MMTPLRNLFVTQNFPPVSGGMARRHAELVNRYGEPIEVSTIARDDAATADAAAPYPINRQPFPLSAPLCFSFPLAAPLYISLALPVTQQCTICSATEY